jgi:hypothetical protein
LGEVLGVAQGVIHMKKLRGIDWGLIVLYVILVIFDLLANGLALFIPSLGALAEGLTEIVLEITGGAILAYFVLR